MIMCEFSFCQKRYFGWKSDMGHISRIGIRFGFRTGERLKRQEEAAGKSKQIPGKSGQAAKLGGKRRGNSGTQPSAAVFAGRPSSCFAESERRTEGASDF